MCETPSGLSTTVTQGKDLHLGEQGEFGCHTNTRPNSSIFQWLVEVNNQTTSINTTDRISIVDDQLVISQLEASDNGSRIRCKVIYATDCEELSHWHQLLFAPKVSSSPTTSPMDLSTSIVHLENITRIHTDRMHVSAVLWSIIGCLSVVLGFVAIFGVATCCHKNLNRPKRPPRVDRAAPTLRRLDSFPVTDPHIYSSHTSQMQDSPLLFGQRSAHTRDDEEQYAARCVCSVEPM